MRVGVFDFGIFRLSKPTARLHVYFAKQTKAEGRNPADAYPPILPVHLAGDNVRFLAKSFNVPGDHVGQASTGYRWPFGPVAIVSPFNFPLG